MYIIFILFTTDDKVFTYFFPPHSIVFERIPTVIELKKKKNNTIVWIFEASGTRFNHVFRFYNRPRAYTAVYNNIIYVYTRTTYYSLARRRSALAETVASRRRRLYVYTVRLIYIRDNSHISSARSICSRRHRCETRFLLVFNNNSHHYNTRYTISSSRFLSYFYKPCIVYVFIRWYTTCTGRIKWL